MYRVGHNRIYAPYMTVYLVISLPKVPYIHRIYIWSWPTLLMFGLEAAGLIVFICRVGQNCICTPYMTAHLAISLPKVPYIHRIYMVLAYLYLFVVLRPISQRGCPISKRGCPISKRGCPISKRGCPISKRGCPI